MTNKITVTCDRCGTEVEGLEYDTATAGFYRRAGGWDAYMDDGEDVICDDCMFVDKRYKADYPTEQGGS